MAIRGQPSEHPSIHQGSVTRQWVSDTKFVWALLSLGDPQALPSQQQPQSWGWRDGLELTALAALLEDLGTIPSTNTVARKHL